MNRNSTQPSGRRRGIFKRRAVVLVLLGLVTFLGQGQPCRAENELDRAVIAAKGGDFATALRIITPLAKQGIARAQYNLGVCYQGGYGVPRNYSQAVKWYRKAAEQEFVLAQMRLGTMYFQGFGVPQNYILAYMWWSLAASRGNAHAAKFRDYLEEKMTPAQIAEAQRRAAEWKPPKSGK